jgi:hypothetical protein
MGKAQHPREKQEWAKGICPCPAKSSWAAAEAARQVSFQVLSGGFRCGALLVQNEDLVRVSEANLDEGHRPVRSGVVNNRIAVLRVGVVFEAASCVDNHIVLVALGTLLESAIR